MADDKAPAAATAEAAAPAGKPAAASSGKKDKKKLSKEERAALAKQKEERKAAFVKGKGKKTGQMTEAFVNKTPKGEKKDLSGEFPSAYWPQPVEAAWYDWWEKKGFFKADENSTKKPFVMMLPPPNVTGSLHVGHALMCSIEDMLTRWKRMQGYEALWIPGMDHAGIATQSVVEKKLWKEKQLSRHDIGREEFVKTVWDWKSEYGGKIQNQMRRLGCSLDWDRDVFTMDAERNLAVREAFVRMYDKGIVFRALRLVNWSCALKSAISDLEVDHIELTGKTNMTVPGHGDRKYPFGVLVEFAYPVENSDEKVIVATTRLETMLGDTAVAIHPDDERYKHLHGKFVIHPINQRRIPIICDKELVKMEFGTGCVKVTPAHDPNDYACGKRHNLEEITIFNEDGTMNEHGAPYQGKKRFDVRLELYAKLKELGLFIGEKPNPMSLGKCSRSGDIIEPMLLPQWWVNCNTMAERAVKAVRSGELKLVPSSFNTTWFYYLENIRDWCISRQLWWGHRIPAYLVHVEGGATPNTNNPDHWVVGRTDEEAMQRAVAKFGVSADKIRLEQDPDVLDTWFSSGLFPFSPLGWPNEDNASYKRFFPSDVLETGHDILFFWVARMAMMSLQLTDKLPFHTVLLHSIVRDAHGRKMSKTLGNVIDPLDVIGGITLQGLHDTLNRGNLAPKEIEKAKKGQKTDFPNGISECGTDGLRFALLYYTAPGRDISLDINVVVDKRNFCNKLWNAVRFALIHLGTDFKPAETAALAGSESAADTWIMSRLQAAITAVNNGIESFDISSATAALEAFWRAELCDVYLELLKPVMGGSDEAAKATSRNVLYTCLDQGLKLLHPLMPFVTEELWQRIPRRPNDTTESIMIAEYPVAQAALVNADVEAKMAATLEIVHAARSLHSRSAKGKVPDALKFPTLHVVIDDASPILSWFRGDYSNALAALTRASNVHVQAASQEKPDGCLIAVVNAAVSVHMYVKGLLDAKREVANLEKSKTRVQSDLSSLAARLADAKFLEAAGQDKVAEAKKRHADLEKELQSITDAIGVLSCFD